jgi:coproporphyrinogen III oxidase-like Fe-S oxidoreductase
MAPVLSFFLRRVTARRLAFDRIGTVSLPPAPAGRDYTLYLHVPFCEQLCPYCSFNRYPFQAGAAGSYFLRLRAELAAVRDLGYRFTSLYVGGGTPTLQIDELSRTLDLVRQLFGPLEVSCETNPNHLTPDRLGPLTGRVHRLSVGVQSFDDGLLEQMRRRERYGGGQETFERLRATAGMFPVLNLDLIYNLPGQTREMLDRDIALAHASRVDQVTFYPLMPSASEPPVPWRQALGSQLREEQFYRQINESLSGRLQPSSAWCFARALQAPIDEYILADGDYVGVGPGAFSFVNGTLYVNAFTLPAYNGAVDAAGHSAVAARTFSQRDQMRYSFLMALFGLVLDKHAFQRQHGVTVERGLPAELAFMRMAGAFDRDDERAITLSAEGRYLVVAMMREFFVGVSRLREQARAMLASPAPLQQEGLAT